MLHPSGLRLRESRFKLPRLICACPVTLDRPVVPSALWESFLPGVIWMLILIIFRLVSYTKHKMRKREM